MNSEFLASLWKNFHGRGILNYTPVLFMCKTFMVRLSTTKTMKILPPKNTRCTVCACIVHMYV